MIKVQQNSLASSVGDEMLAFTAELQSELAFAAEL